MSLFSCENAETEIINDANKVIKNDFTLDHFPRTALS